MNVDVALAPGEVVVRIIRHYFFGVIPTVLFGVIIFVIGLGLIVVGMASGVIFMALIGLLLAVLGAAWIIIGIIVYFGTMLIVTNQNLIMVHRFGLFNRELSHFSLSRVFVVDGRTSGFFATFFNYGTLFARSADGPVSLTMTYVHGAEQVAADLTASHSSFIQANPLPVHNV